MRPVTLHSFKVKCCHPESDSHGQINTYHHRSSAPLHGESESRQSLLDERVESLPATHQRRSQNRDEDHQDAEGPKRLLDPVHRFPEPVNPFAVALSPSGFCEGSLVHPCTKRKSQKHAFLGFVAKMTLRAISDERMEDRPVSEPAFGIHSLTHGNPKDWRSDRVHRSLFEY